MRTNQVTGLPQAKRKRIQSRLVSGKRASSVSEYTEGEELAADVEAQQLTTARTAKKESETHRANALGSAKTKLRTHWKSIGLTDDECAAALSSIG